MKVAKLPNRSNRSRVGNLV